jgi:hypothetical protein
MTRERFATGLTYKDFLKNANDQYDLYEHHYKRTRIMETNTSIFSGLDKEINILIITEAHCPDSAVVVPVIYKWMEAQKNINLRILTRDRNLDVMNVYLTNGAQAIPKVIVFDKDFKTLGTWGPRPKHIQDYFEQYRAQIKSGKTDKSEVHKKMRQLYAKDRGQSIIAELAGIVE